MKLRMSYFNPTIFRRNLAKSWPLWGGTSVLMMLIGYANCYREEQFLTHTMRQAIDTTGGIWMIYALIAAMLCFHYLHTHRSAQMLHAYPVSRVCQYVTAVASGLVMFLIPMCAGLLFSVVQSPHMKTFSLQAVGMHFGFCFLAYIFFFGLAVLCMHMTGRSVVAAGLFGVFNGIVPITEILINILIVSPKNDEMPIHGSFAPLWWIMEHNQADSYYQYLGNDNYDYVEKVSIDWTYLWILFAIGLAFLVAAMLLYRYRHMESAEDVIAQKWLQPIFRAVAAAESALFFALFMLAFILRDGNDYLNDEVPKVPVLLLIIGGAIGFYAAQMLLKRTLRVFDKKTFVKYLIFAAALIGLMLLYKLYMLG